MKLELRSVRIKNCGPIDDIKIDFFDASGETLPVCVIGGANGSGKTTLLEVITAMAEMLVPQFINPLEHPVQKSPEYLNKRKSDYLQVDLLVGDNDLSLFYGVTPDDEVLSLEHCGWGQGPYPNTLMPKFTGLASEIRQRIATRSTTLNERVLRRLSAELHDGPAQDLGFALLKLDSVDSNASPRSSSDKLHATQVLETIQTSIARALGEMRTIAAGMSVPELDHLSLKETLLRVINNHKRRSQTEVQFILEETPEELALPVKITLYRLVQESLTNAFKHADGQGQTVRLFSKHDHLHLEISDAGPGFVLDQSLERTEGLGLLGMRERVESVGGSFEIESAPGAGTRVKIVLPLENSSNP